MFRLPDDDETNKYLFLSISKIFKLVGVERRTMLLSVFTDLGSPVEVDLSWCDSHQ